MATRRAQRALELGFADGREPPPGRFDAWRLEVDEALSRDFRITVDVVADEAELDTAALLGRSATVALRREDGGVRHFNGVVFECRLLRDGVRFALYRLVLRPWLALLRERIDSRVFHGLNTEAQTRRIFDEHRFTDWSHEGLTGDRVLTDAFQLDESDHDQLHRRWEARGWHYRYEHRADGHRLVLGADTGAAASIGADGRIRWHRAEGGVQRGLRSVVGVRRLGSERVTLSAFDFKRPEPERAGAVLEAPEAVPPLERHSYLGAYGLPMGSAQHLVQLRLEELEARAELIEAEGDDDRVQPGRSFVLDGERAQRIFGADEDARAFVILEARHSITVQHDAIGDEAGSADEGDYRCRIVCVRRTVPWRPGVGFSSAPLKAPPPQTARVVGPSGADLHTDAHGRVRVQFHWDREGRRDAGSSAWIRVATPWGGAENGLHAVPRVGSEVLVQWLDADPDRPLVVACLHNATNMPPWTLPSQQALTGLRTRELGGGGNAAGGCSNQLVFDDTPGELQAQLRSDVRASQLALGRITRIETTAGRQDARGEGFELRSDARGALRAGEGMLISTEARSSAVKHATDADETWQRLDEAGQLHRQLGEAAVKAEAQAGADQTGLATSLKGQHDALRGPGAGKEFAQPHLALASPAGIESTTAGSTHQASRQHHAITSGGLTSFAAGTSLFASAAQAIRLFAVRAGMKLVAAAGDIDVRALSDSIRMLAKLNITHTAERITLEATKEIVINGAGSVITLSGAGIVGKTAGTFDMKAAKHVFDPPDNGPVPELPAAAPPEALKRQQRLLFSLSSHAVDGQILGNEPFDVFKDGALFQRGATDALGRLFIDDHVDGTSRYTVRLGVGTTFDLHVRDALDPAAAIERLSNQGFRSADASGATGDYGAASREI